MAVSVTNVDALQTYIQGVMARAEHHANDVDEIALALAGAIAWRKDSHKPIKVMVKSGATKNVLWVYLGGSRYAFSYSHSTGIEMREKSTHGPVLHTFTNATSLSKLKKIFEVL